MVDFSLHVGPLTETTERDGKFRLAVKHVKKLTADEFLAPMELDGADRCGRIYPKEKP